MTLAVALILAILVAIYIALPFFQNRIRHLSFEVNHRAEDLETRKKEIYAAIRDIDFDLKMGKLSEEDHQELKEQYKQDAIHLLKEIDQIQSPAPQRKGKESEAKQVFCHACGAPLARNDQFCGACGTQMD